MHFRLDLPSHSGRWAFVFAGAFLFTGIERAVFPAFNRRGTYLLSTPE